ncbi:MAG: hypothetical protein F6J90_10085 [Moorea sp. SIOASIH]|nr:hypothetical protein [Moorena sp. SIOASIH]NEO36653.1 hypothetical protein [Moorena sp. SIOASIH]NEO92388.1 hypothetical protein [Moorena sp. SIO3G5]
MSCTCGTFKYRIRSRIGVNPNLTDFFLGSRESGVGSRESGVGKKSFVPN